MFLFIDTVNEPQLLAPDEPETLSYHKATVEDAGMSNDVEISGCEIWIIVAVEQASL